MGSEHREALLLHRQILDRQKEVNHHQADIAKETLAAERSRLLRARYQHRQDLKSAKAEAQEYKVVWLQAKKDGERLLRFVDRRLRKAA